MPEKVLIVYYSLTGNTKMIAEAIAEGINADILALKPKKELNPKGFMKFVWGGYRAMMNKKPELVPIDINPLDYDIIILGSPVWAWTFSPPMRSFISKYDLTGKKLALLFCAGSTATGALEKIKKALKDVEIIGETKFFDPDLKKDPEGCKQKAIDWAKEIINK